MLIAGQSSAPSAKLERREPARRSNWRPWPRTTWRSVPPRRRRQGLEFHAAGASAPPRGVRSPPARRLHHPPARPHRRHLRAPGGSRSAPLLADTGAFPSLPGAPAPQDKAGSSVIHTSRHGTSRLSALAHAALCPAVLIVIHLSELQRRVDHEVAAEVIDLLVNLDHFVRAPGHHGSACDRV